MTSKELGAHYYAVLDDLERQYAKMHDVIVVVAQLAQAHSEQGMRDHDAEKLAPQTGLNDG